jgi:hypothetical protein
MGDNVSDPDPDPNLDPDSHWTRIQTGENQPPKKEELSPKTRKNYNICIFYAVVAA